MLNLTALERDGVAKHILERELLSISKSQRLAMRRNIAQFVPRLQYANGMANVSMSAGHVYSAMVADLTEQRANARITLGRCGSLGARGDVRLELTVLYYG